MLTKFISFKRLAYDGLEWHIEISASNGDFAGVQDCYTYSEDLDLLGINFSKFPETIQDEVRFELGNRIEFAYYILIRAFLFNSVGHAAIEFMVDNNATSPNHSQTSFFIHTAFCITD